MLNRCWKTCHACRILLNVMSTISSWPTLQSRVNGAVWEAFYEYLEGCWCSGNQGWRGEGSSRWGSWALMFSGARTSILINPHHNSLGAMLWDIFNAIKPSSVQQENSLDVQDNMKWFFQVWQSPPWTGFEMFRLSENWATQRFFSSWRRRYLQMATQERSGQFGWGGRLVECEFKFTKLLLLAVPSFYLDYLLLSQESWLTLVPVCSLSSLSLLSSLLMSLFSLSLSLSPLHFCPQLFCPRLQSGETQTAQKKPTNDVLFKWEISDLSFLFSKRGTCGWPRGSTPIAFERKVSRHMWL